MSIPELAGTRVHRNSERRCAGWLIIASKVMFWNGVRGGVRVIVRDPDVGRACTYELIYPQDFETVRRARIWL